MKKIIIIILLLMTTGCWDRREIKDLAVVNSVFFDYKDGNIVFMAELINAKAESVGTTGATQYVPYFYIKGTGKEILDATNDSTLSVNNRLYYAHMKTIFLSETFAKEIGELPVLDLISRFTETRQNSHIVIVRDDDVEKLYNSTTSYSDFFGNFIEENEKSQFGRLSKSVYTTALEAIRDYYSKGKNGVLGVIDIKDLEEGEINNSIAESYGKIKDNTKIKVEGAAVLNNGKLYKLLDGNQTVMYNYIRGNIKQLNLIVDPETLFVKFVKTKINTKIDKNKKVTIDVNIKLETTIGLSSGEKSFNNFDTLKKIQDKSNTKLEKELKEFLDTSQKDIGIDFLGFGDYFHIQNPKEWKKIEDKWDDYFKDAIINVKVNTTIISSGKITKSFELEE